MVAPPNTTSPTALLAQPWHAAYPEPTLTAASVTRQEVLRWFRDGRQPGKDFVLVDLRRTDFEVFVN